MSSAGLSAGRLAAERQMLDTFTAYGAPTWVKVDGLDEEARAVQYATRGKVQGLGGLRGNDPQTRTVTVGGVERPVMNGGIHIPISADAPAVGWQYVVTAVGPSSDPALLGRVYEVVESPAKSYATSRRLDVVEIPQEAP